MTFTYKEWNTNILNIFMQVHYFLNKILKFFPRSSEQCKVVTTANLRTP